MISYVSLAVLGLVAAYAALTYRAFMRNLAEAKKSGVPYICMPFYNFNPFWLVTHRLWLPILEKLPSRFTQPWVQYTEPDWMWQKMYKCFKEYDSDMLMIVSPGKNTLYVADPQACSQITTRRNDFPKPIEIYTSVDLFGKNVVSTEGAIWRHHRKITSPPFTEKSNQLVWRESLHQAQMMVEGWMPKGVKDSGPVWDVASQAMRLSLHVISRAGFGVRLTWPHEEGSDQAVPEGHTLTYKDALSLLLENIIVVMLTPHWLLKRSPLKFHQVAWESFVEWGKYMKEMYHDKREEVKKGESREGLDLMGALVKGAGITSESLNATDNGTDPEKGNGQLLTDDEILGNAFVFILAGHETAANTIHFSLLFLAMNWGSQERLQKDLDAILGDRPASEWDYDEDVPKLFGSMCGAVMNEELRLIPPVIGIPKSTAPGRPQGLQSQGKQITVPGGAFVNLVTAALHRNPKYWPHTSEEDLLSFRPERWLLEDTITSGKTADDGDAYAEEEGLDFDGPDKRADTAPSLFRPEKGSYVPFSEGYRSCLGRRFAQVEILAVLATIFKYYSVELDVQAFMTDEELEVAEAGARQVVWDRARARAVDLLENGMMTIITIQMRKGKVPMRFVKRGEEKFKFG